MWWKYVGLAGVSLLSFAPPAQAQQGVSFHQAVASVERGPRIAGLSEATRVRESGDGAITGLPSDPQLQVMPGVRLAPDGDEGFELQVTLTQSITLGALGTARRRAAEQEREELAMQRQAELLTLRLDTAKTWIDAWALAEESAALAREEASVVEVIDRVRRAVDAGERTRRELGALQVYAEQLHLHVMDVRARLEGTNRALAMNMGLGDREVSAEGPLPDVGLPELAEISVHFDVLEALPSVAQLRLASLSATARAAEARAESLSQLQLGISLQADHPGGFVAFSVIGFQPRLAATDARARSVQLAEAARLEGEHAQGLREARRFAADVLGDLERTRQYEDALSTRLLPAARSLVELEDEAFAAREGNVLTVLDARRRLIESERMLALGRAARTWSEVKAWLLLAAMHGDATHGDATHGDATLHNTRQSLEGRP